MDGDPKTAWRVGAFSPVEGEKLDVDLAAPVTTDHLTLLQPITGPRNRWMTRVRLRFDGTDTMDVDLGDSSRESPGQRIDFGTRTFHSLEIEVLGDNFGTLPDYKGLTSVGIAELAIGDQPPRVDEVVRLPTDLLTAAGDRSADHRLTVLLSRQRADQHEPIRTEPELSISRTFSLPTARTFTVSGHGAGVGHRPRRRRRRRPRGRRRRRRPRQRPPPRGSVDARRRRHRRRPDDGVADAPHRRHRPVADRHGAAAGHDRPPRPHRVRRRPALGAQRALRRRRRGRPGEGGGATDRRRHDAPRTRPSRYGCRYRRPSPPAG